MSPYSCGHASPYSRGPPHILVRRIHVDLSRPSCRSYRGLLLQGCSLLFSCRPYWHVFARSQHNVLSDGRTCPAVAEHAA